MRPERRRHRESIERRSPCENAEAQITVPGPGPKRRNTRLRFEQWAHNPACAANTVSAVLGISMAEVARVEGVPPTMGQSPFAIMRGNQFERALFRDDAQRMREALVDAGVLPVGPTPFRDLRIRKSGGPLRKLDVALRETSTLLHQIAEAGASGDGKLPAILASATISIPGGIMLPEAVLVLDVLVIRYDQKLPTLVVGEVKTFPDRGGHTDGGQLATARAQAGVYVHGLQLTLAELGLADRIAVSTTGFLVFSRPGYNLPSVRAGEDLRYQARRAERGFARLRAVAATMPRVEEGITVGNAIERVLAADCAYDEACVSFCDRAASCHSRALERGDPAALGGDVARFLNGIDLHRAVALLSGAVPSNAAEADLVRRVRETRELGGMP